MRNPRTVAACAVAALAVLALPAASDARPRAVIAFLPPGQDESRPLLDELASRGMAVGVVSPTVGGFKKRQVGLDIGQGTRIPTRLYSGEIGALRFRDGRLSGWAQARARAADAPGDLRPGLLAQAVADAGGRVGWAGPAGGFAIGAVVAADERGRVRRASRDMLGVYDLPAGMEGLRTLDAILARATPDDFVLVMRAPYGDDLRLLPVGIAASGIRGRLRSATTRRNGLIAATDIAPTVLRFLGVPVPDDMQGQRIEGRGDPDPTAVQEMVDRLVVVTPRRGDALRWIGGAWLALLVALRLAAGRRGLRAALRAGFLGLLWLPGVALLAAALAPERMAEAALLGVGAVALGAATDRLVRWPVAPALPALVVFAAHAIDLARGSPLIGASIAGPNPAGGARFFGIGNELETLLSLSVLLGTGAALAGRRSARAPVAFALAALVAALVMGAGRLGADVGAVITLGAGAAAAVVASLPGGPSRRAVALAVGAPVLAVVALIVIDLATGGGAHLTRSVLDAGGTGDLADVVKRRFEGSFSSLKKPGWAAAFAVAVAVLAWLAVARERFFHEVPAPFAAGLAGAWFAVVVGAISNDSAPVIVLIGGVALLLAAAYARGRPETTPAPPQ